MKASEGKAPLFPASGPGPLAQSIPAFSREGWILTLTVVVLLLVTRPFVGIFHDAHYYAVQALQRLDGNTLHRDLIFRFGNQDSFSPFTRVYAPLIKWLGLGSAYQLLWVTGMLLWVAGLIYLARQIFGGTRKAYVAAGLALALTSNYGVVMLQYGENFVSPRLFAEGFALFSIGLLLRRDYVLATAFLVACMVCHPLVGLALVIFAAWCFLPDWRAFAALGLGGLAALLALGLTGVEPFVWAFQMIDPEWQAVLDDINSIVFLSQWPWGKVLALTFFQFVVFVAIWRAGPSEAARFARSLLILWILVLVGSAIAADLLLNRFLAALQFWRALLFVALFANMMVVFVPTLGPQYSRTKSFLLMAAGFNILEASFEMIPIGAAILSAGALVSVFFEKETRDGNAALVLRALGLSIAVFGVFASLSTLLFLLLSRSPVTWHVEAVLRFAVIVCAGWVLVWGRGRLPAFLVVAALIVGLITLDDRSARQIYVESTQPIPQDAQALMQGKTVYWEASLDLQWFKLRVPAYFHCRHQTGSAFYRGQALEYARLYEALKVLETADLVESQLALCSKIPDRDQRLSGSEALVSVCRSLPDLELVVLRRQIADKAIYQFQIPAPAEARPFNMKGQTALQKTTTYHVHDCRSFRSTR